MKMNRQCEICFEEIGKNNVSGLCRQCKKIETSNRKLCKKCGKNKLSPSNVSGNCIKCCKEIEKSKQHHCKHCNKIIVKKNKSLICRDCKTLYSIKKIYRQCKVCNGSVFSYKNKKCDKCISISAIKNKNRKKYLKIKCKMCDTLILESNKYGLCKLHYLDYLKYERINNKKCCIKCNCELPYVRKSDICSTCERISKYPICKYKGCNNNVTRIGRIYCSRICFNKDRFYSKQKKMNSNLSYKVHCENIENKIKKKICKKHNKTFVGDKCFTCVIEERDNKIKDKIATGKWKLCKCGGLISRTKHLCRPCIEKNYKERKTENGLRKQYSKKKNNLIL